MDYKKDRSQSRRNLSLVVLFLALSGLCNTSSYSYSSILILPSQYLYVYSDEPKMYDSY
jgi:hypothetical protein